MRNDHRRLVLVVDTDQRFIDDARPVLADHRVLAARDLEEAREIVSGGRVDLVLLGPAFASDIAINQARTLISTDSSVQLVLAAEVVTNRLLKAALRGGFADVLETPLSERDLSDLVVQVPQLLPTATEIQFVVEPAAWREIEEPDSPSEIATPAPGVAADPFGLVPPEPPGADDSPVSVATPAEVAFNAEAGPLEDKPPMALEHLPPVVTDVPEPEAPIAPTPVEPPQPDPRLEEPPAWPEDEPADAMEFDLADEVLPPELPAASGLAPLIPEATPLGPEMQMPMPPAMPPTEFLNEVSLPTRPEGSPPVDSSEEAEEAEETETAREPYRTRSQSGRVIAVMAGKGGSGKTVTATNLAIAIGMRSDPERVAIVDADLQFGDVALMLEIDPVRTLGELVGRVDQMTDERLEAALIRHETGIRVAPAPLLPIGSEEIDAKSVVEVVDRLRSIFDTVIVDTGPVFDDGLITILEHSDQVITVVDMDLPSVKNTKIALDGLRQIGFDMARIRLVVNRSNSKARLDVAELERTLGLRVGGSIPSDRLVPQSVNAGVPALVSSPRSRVARAFHALAESLDPKANGEGLGAQ